MSTEPTRAEHVLGPDDLCPCGQPQEGSGYCSYPCFSKYEMGAPLLSREAEASARLDGDTFCVGPVVVGETAQPPASGPGTVDPTTGRGTGVAGTHARTESHWLAFKVGQVTGCHCGFRANLDSDRGWGDSVVAHLVQVGADAARPVHLREAAASLRAIAQARLATAPDPVAVARALGLEDAARRLESTARDHADTQEET
jgi:hypothetical protein